METRKAQLTGGSTYTVSLPKEWAKGIDLDTGDTLNLFPDTKGGTLVIEPADAPEDYWEGTIDVDDVSPIRVRRVVQALYTGGFNRIELTAASGLGENRRVVSTTARKFIGLEIIESTDTKMVLQSLLDSGTVSVEQATIQLEQVALSMHEDAVDALLEDDADLVEHVAERDDQVDRLYAMLSRHFHRSLESFRETEALTLDQPALYDFQTTARQLERVADHAEKLAKLVDRFESPIEPDIAIEIESAAAECRDVVAHATSTITGDADIETAHRALDDRDAVIGKLEALQQELHEGEVTESHLVALTLDSLTRTAEYGANVAEAALQSAARGREL